MSGTTPYDLSTAIRSVEEIVSNKGRIFGRKIFKLKLLHQTGNALWLDPANGKLKQYARWWRIHILYLFCPAINKWRCIFSFVVSVKQIACSWTLCAGTCCRKADRTKCSPLKNLTIIKCFAFDFYWLHELRLITNNQLATFMDWKYHSLNDTST